MTRALVVLLAIAAAVQAPRGSVTGRVITAAGERPVAGAQVLFHESDYLRGATTDADGRFRIDNVSFGSRNRLWVSLPGFLSTGFGYEPLLGHTPFVLSPGETTPEVVLRLYRGATIAGRVVDDTGEPVVSVRVRAFPLSDRAGRRLLHAAARGKGVATASGPGYREAETDDRGDYRIINVEPGSYVVGAVDRTVATFAPAAARLADATVVTVGMDDVRTGVNVRAPRVSAGAVVGVVSLPSGGVSGVSTLWVDLLRDSDEARLLPLRQRLDATGRFRFDDVPVGRYTLFVNPAIAPEGPHVWARESIAVAANATTERDLALQDGVRVSGRVEGPFHPASRIELGRVQSDQFAGRSSARPGSTFTLRVSPGRYVWGQSQGMPTNASRLMRAYIGDDEITDVPLVVEASRPVENIRLVVEDAAVITGTVRDADGRPTSAGAVVIATTVRRFQTEISNRIRLVRADNHGVFRERGLPAGRYRISHIASLTTSHIWEPAFLDALRGVEVNVAAGESVTVAVSTR